MRWVEIFHESLSTGIIGRRDYETVFTRGKVERKIIDYTRRRH